MIKPLYISCQEKKNQINFPKDGDYNCGISLPFGLFFLDFTQTLQSIQFPRR